MNHWFLLCLAVVALPCPSRAQEWHLTKRSVIRLADAAAKRAGYDLYHFQRPDAGPAPTGHGRDWVAFYEGKSDRNGISTIGNHFFVRVADRDGRASIVPGR